jgi:hypothetical protein
MIEDDYDEILYTIKDLDLILSKGLNMTRCEEKEVKGKIDKIIEADFCVHSSNLHKHNDVVKNKVSLTTDQRAFLMYVLPVILNKRKDGVVSSEFIKNLMNAVNLCYDNDVFIIFHEGDSGYTFYGV